MRVIQVLGPCRLGTSSIRIKNRGDGPPSLINWFLLKLYHRKTFNCFSFCYWYFQNQWELSPSLHTMYILVANFAQSAVYVTISKNAQNWVIWNHRHLLKVSHQRDWQVARLGFHISNLWNLCYGYMWKPEASFWFWRRNNLKCQGYQHF